MRLNQGYFSGQPPEDGPWYLFIRESDEVISVTFAVSLDMAGDQSAFVRHSDLNLPK